MPVSTVGSGKAYSTLQAWWDNVYSNSGTEEAECYSGSDLGSLLMQDFFVDVVVIRVAPGHQHNGTDAGTAGVAYTSGSIICERNGNTFDFTIRGLRTHDDVLCFNDFNGQHSRLIEDMLFVRGGTAAGSGGNIQIDASDLDGIPVTSDVTTIRNCIGLFKTTAGTIPFLRVLIASAGGDGVSGGVILYNNTVIRSGIGTMNRGFSVDAPGDVILRAQNNIVLGSSGGDYEALSGVNIETASHNMSSDATGDDWGATGAKINQVAASVVVNPSTDPTLLETSPAKDAGTTAPDFSDDAIGQTRPQGPAWDMGALELFQEVVGRFRRSRILKFWHNH